MAVYVITGELGSGKSLAVIKKIQDYLSEGRRVATNLNLRMEHLMRKGGHNVVRLPDHPNRAALDFLGVGYHEYDEKKFGGIFLDEAATFLNSREWNDKTRADVIKWLLHARKLRWDVFLIIQDLTMLDKQVRSALVEHHVYCRRLDRIGIPIVGFFARALGFKTPKLPQIHVAVVKYGTSNHAPVVDKWPYSGKRLWRAYDTMQKILGESQSSVYDAPSTVLDVDTAPYIRRPVGGRESYRLFRGDLVERFPSLAYWLPEVEASEEVQRHLDFMIAERDGFPSGKPLGLSISQAYTRDACCARLARSAVPIAGTCGPAEASQEWPIAAE